MAGVRSPAPVTRSHRAFCPLPRRVGAAGQRVHAIPGARLLRVHHLHRGIRLVRIAAGGARARTADPFASLGLCSELVFAACCLVSCSLFCHGHFLSWISDLSLSPRLTFHGCRGRGTRRTRRCARSRTTKASSRPCASSSPRRTFPAVRHAAQAGHTRPRTLFSRSAGHN